MKTTLELPDDLYHEAKTRAATDKRKLKDMLSDGLRVVLAAGAGCPPANGQNEARQILNALDDILRCPPLEPGRIAALQAEVRRLRSEGWNRGDAE